MFRRSKTDRRCESEDVRRAREAAEIATAERERIEAKAPEAELIGDAIRTALRVNHFGEQIERAWRLRRGIP